MATLYIVATPIGNMEDITIRAIKTLFSVDYIACEDTRKTGNLIQSIKLKMKNDNLKIKNIVDSKNIKFISYYDEVEETKTPEIIDLLEQGNFVALVSDAGTPLIADPGFKLVRECLKRNIRVESIPGPSSIISALVSSGLPPNQFLFLGYLPTKSNKRKKSLQGLYSCISTSVQSSTTVIFFETPHRIKESLEDLMEVFGDREIVIARELTKMHEEIWRGKVSEAIKREFRGELIVLCRLSPDACLLIRQV